MVKPKKKPAVKVPADDPSPGKPAGAFVKTIHGEVIADGELQHIAPALRSFAIAVDQIKRDPNNARRHGDEDLASTAASLKQFGQQHLLHFDPTTKFVKVGNGRHEAGSAVLGWKYMAAVPSNLPPEQLRAFALADNRTAEKSDWDHEALQRELDALGDLQIDLSDVGFAAADLQEIEQSLSDLDADEAGTIPMKRRRKESTTAGNGGGDANETDAANAGTPQYKIVINCASEAQQANLLERFNAEGLSVSARTL